MPKKWSDVAGSAAFQALTPEEQEEARWQYFDDVVAPHVESSEIDAVRSMFDADTVLGGDRRGRGPSRRVGPRGDREPEPHEPPEITRSLAPLTDQARTSIRAQYDAATPAQRARMVATPGVIGQVAKQLQEQYARMDDLPLGPGGRATDRVDTRAEARERQHTLAGVAPDAASVRSRYEAQQALPTGEGQPRRDLLLSEIATRSAQRGWASLQQLVPALGATGNALALQQMAAIDRGELSDPSQMGVLAEQYWNTKPEDRTAFRQRWAEHLPAEIAKDAQVITELQKQKESLPGSFITEEVMRADSFKQAISALARDPVRFLADIGPESLVSSAPGLVAAIPASIAGGPVGGATAMGANSFAVDMAQALISGLQEAGVDTANPEALKAALNDRKLMQPLVDSTIKRSSVVAGFDFASGGLAARSMIPARALAGRPVTRELVNLGVQTQAQGALGAAGEAGGQVAAGKEIRPGEVLAEYVGEFASAPAEVAAMAASQARQATPALASVTGGTVHTPPDSLSAQMGLTPIVVPNISPNVKAKVAQEFGLDKLQEQPNVSAGNAVESVPASDGAISGVDTTRGLDDSGLAPAVGQSDGVSAALPLADRQEDRPVPSASGEQASPVETWFGRRGDGYVTEGDATQALPGRQKRNPELDWKVEPINGGKYRLAGYARQVQLKEPPIAQFRRDANEIERSLPTVERGKVRLWRGNRPGEVGKNPSFTNDLPGIALPFRKAYGGNLSYVDVPEESLSLYEVKVGAAPGAEFFVPAEVASRARVVRRPGSLDTAANVAATSPRLAGDAAPAPTAASTKMVVPPEIANRERPVAQAPSAAVTPAKMAVPLEIARKEAAAASRGEAVEQRAAVPAPDKAPATSDRNLLGDLLERALRREAMEAHGQGILDDMTERGETPRSVGEQFWRDTYYKLNAQTQARFQRYAKNLGFEPGVVLFTKADGSVIEANDWQDIGEFLVGDMPQSADQLEGIERGFVSLMKWANDQAEQLQSVAPESELDKAAHDSATSPMNRLPEPTDAQKEAGNYRKGHVRIQGLNVSIENPKGSMRRSKADVKEKWEVEMPAHYGYIRGTEGADGDHIDVTLGAQPDDESLPVLVFDQAKQDGKFDEHKVFMGFKDEAGARATYRASFAGDFGKKMEGSLLGVRSFSAEQFKSWLANGDHARPASVDASITSVKESPSSTVDEGITSGEQGRVFEAAQAVQTEAQGSQARATVAAGIRSKNAVPSGRRDDPGQTAKADVHDRGTGLSRRELEGLELAPPAPLRVLETARAQIKKATGVEIAQVHPAEMSDGARVASAVARIYKKTLSVVSGDGLPLNGFLERMGGDHIIIANDTEDAPLSVAIHEIYHSLPEERRKPLNEALLALTREDRHSEFAKRFSYSDAEVAEELPAFIAQALSKRPQFWRDVREKMGNKEFAEVARVILDKLKDLVNALQRDRGEAFLQRYVKDIQRAHDLLTDEYAAAVRGDAPARPAKVSGGLALSKRDDKLPQGMGVTQGEVGDGSAAKYAAVREGGSRAAEQGGPGISDPRPRTERDGPTDQARESSDARLSKADPAARDRREDAGAALRRYRKRNEGQSRSYARKSGGDGGSLRILGVSTVAEFAPSTDLKDTLSSIDAASPTLYELGADGAPLFHDAISASKEGNKFGAAVYVYPEDEYRSMRLFIARDGRAGFALKDSDIVSVFSLSPHKGSVAGMLELAVQEGGRRLDAFNTILPKLYARNGFKIVARLRWNEEHKPDGWDKATFQEYNNGEPDIVFMVHDPKYEGVPSNADGSVVGSYDDAIVEQKKAIEKAYGAPRFSNRERPARPGVVASNRQSVPFRRPWIFERDSLGRFRFAAGARAYRLAADVANAVLDKIKMKPVSSELGRAMRLMRTEINKAKELAADVAGKLGTLSPEEREMISDVIEGELRAGITPPEKIVALAANMQHIMSEQTKQLVELGMISEDAAGRWEGKYLPRFYQKQFKDELKSWAQAARQLFGKKGAMQGIGGSSLKARGLWKDIPVEELPAYEQNGWEVRDEHYDPAESDQVTIWRDFTKEERIAMNEIRDAMFRFVMGYMRSQKDIALGRLYKHIAETKASKSPRDGYVMVPDTSVEGTTAKRYGKLAGMWVPQEVMDHLSAADSSEMNEIFKLYLKGLSAWKEGRALALDTPIPTPSGWTTMGALKVGNEVFDERGIPCKVMYVTGVQMYRECYEVEFSCGEKIVADAEHLWFTLKGGKPGKVRNTIQIRDSLKEHTRGDNRHSIPVAKALQLPDAELAVHPYVMGYWLGNGSSRCAAVTCWTADFEELKYHIANTNIGIGSSRKDPRGEAVTFSLRFAPPPGAELRRVNGLQPTLRRLGVLGSKHIPLQYLRSSEWQRMELLRGLMDSDGYIDPDGRSCVFTAADESLTKQVAELLISLGYKPNCGVKKADPKMKRPNDHYIVRFRAHSDRPCFKLERKVARLVAAPNRPQRSSFRKIVSVARVPSVPVKCIQVSSESRLYLAGSGMVPTHNTVLNPVSHVNNIVSNVTLAHMAGVSYWDAHKYAMAVRDFVKGSKMMTEAREAGLFGGTFNQEDLKNSMPEQLRMLAGMSESAVKRMGSKIFNALSWWLRKPLQKAYEGEDLFFRYLIYRDARGRGLSTEAAVEYSQEYIFTYDDLPKGARALRDTVVPFFSWTYKAIPALARTTFEYPWRMAAPAAVLYGANAAMYMIATAAADGEDDSFWELMLRYVRDPEFRSRVRELQDLEQQDLPPWHKGKTALGTPKVIRMAQDDVTNLPMYLDVSRLIPGGDIFDTENNAGGIPWLAPIEPGGPAVNVLFGMFGNLDYFTGKNITTEADTDAEAARKRASWMYQSMAPSIAPFGYHFNRTMNAIAYAADSTISLGPVEYTGFGKDGLPVQPSLAALQLFGIKLRPVDLDQSRAIQESQRRHLMRDINAEISSLKRLRRNGAISEDAYYERFERAREKKARLRQGLTVDGEEEE